VIVEFTCKKLRLSHSFMYSLSSCSFLHDTRHCPRKSNNTDTNHLQLQGIARACMRCDAYSIYAGAAEVELLQRDLLHQVRVSSRWSSTHCVRQPLLLESAPRSLIMIDNNEEPPCCRVRRSSHLCELIAYAQRLLI
jgi:hypothetical protein